MTTKEAKMIEQITAQDEVNELVARAKAAQQQFLKLDQMQVDQIIQQMALAGIDRHMVLAKLAVEETGGVFTKIKLPRIYLLRNISTTALKITRQLE